MEEPTPVHLHLHTTDPEVASQALHQLYTRTRMGTVGDPASFLFSQDVHGDTNLSFGGLRFHGTVAGHLHQEQTFSVIAPRAGSVRWEIDGHYATGPGVFLLQPGQHYTGQSQHLAFDSVNLGVSALVDTARTVYGDDELEVTFEDPRPVSPTMAAYWEATHRFVHETMTDPQIAQAPLLRADLLRQMAVATLQTFPLTGEPATGRAKVGTHQRAYYQAVEFMHAGLSLPITVEDVARHAGISTIDLTRTFRSHADTTPGSYLRELRLAAAHQDLVAGDPTAGDTVAAIATRWGFTRPDAFATAYHQCYQQSPSHTLHT